MRSDALFAVNQINAKNIVYHTS